jgi:hypothetical protein
VQSLKNLVWEEKRVTVFLFGDFAFLSGNFGLSGAAGTHPCLWCLAVNKENQGIQLPPDTNNLPKLRTLDMLKSDHQKFLVLGNGIKSNVGQYNNCLHEPLLDIELECVAPPYLHILLGVVTKHHQLLKEVADNIDTKISEDKTNTNCTRAKTIQNLKTFGQNWKVADEIILKIRELKNKIEITSNQVELPHLNCKLRDLKKELKKS